MMQRVKHSHVPPILTYSIHSLPFLSLFSSRQLAYLTEENWSTMVSGYRSQCEGQGLGVVSAYEKEEAEASETNAGDEL